MLTFEIEMSIFDTHILIFSATFYAVIQKGVFNGITRESY